MSIFSDYSVGAASYDDMVAYCNMESAKDKAAEEVSEEAYNCMYYKDGCCSICGQLCNGCE